MRQHGFLMQGPILAIDSPCFFSFSGHDGRRLLLTRSGHRPRFGVRVRAQSRCAKIMSQRYASYAPSGLTAWHGIDAEIANHPASVALQQSDSERHPAVLAVSHCDVGCGYSAASTSHV